MEMLKIVSMGNISKAAILLLLAQSANASLHKTGTQFNTPSPEPIVLSAEKNTIPVPELDQNNMETLTPLDTNSLLMVRETAEEKAERKVRQREMRKKVRARLKKGEYGELWDLNFSDMTVGTRGQLYTNKKFLESGAKSGQLARKLPKSVAKLMLNATERPKYTNVYNAVNKDTKKAIRKKAGRK